MPPSLIVNADDFGLTHGINNAIAELHDAGAVTSATLMAAGPAFEHAATLARTRPTLGIGCHIVLTDGVPVSPPRAIPSLLARNSYSFRPKLVSFLAAMATNQVDPDEVEREAIAQIQRIQRAGLIVTHIDTHKHVHIFPAILRPLLRAALRTGVPAIRNPFEQPWAFPLSNGSQARTSQVRLIQVFQRRFLKQPLVQSGQIRTTDGTIGVSATGSLDETTLRNLVQAIPDGTWELVCHPGFNDAELAGITTRLRDSRDIERNALLAVLSRSASQQVSELAGQRVQSLPSKDSHAIPQLRVPELIHYGNLINGQQPNPLPR